MISVVIVVEHELCSFAKWLHFGGWEDFAVKETVV